jgi:predicted RNA-binding protein YlxR (DUF448 family)
MNPRTDDNPRTMATATRTWRTCVGCGLRDDKAAMVRLALAGEQVVFNAQIPNGRGAHMHPRVDCIVRTPRGLARAFKTSVRVGGADLGRTLVIACERRMVGLLLAAWRSRSLAIGSDAGRAAITGGAPLAIVATDAGSVRGSIEVERAVSEGRAIAWKTKNELGALLGGEAVALCAVRHAGIASELRFMRAAVDAGTAATREGAECSRRPEAR